METIRRDLTRWYVWAGALLFLVLADGTGVPNDARYWAAYALEFLLLAVGCRFVWRRLHRGRADHA